MYHVSFYCLLLFSSLIEVIAQCISYLQYMTINSVAILQNYLSCHLQNALLSVLTMLKIKFGNVSYLWRKKGER